MDKIIGVAISAEQRKKLEALVKSAPDLLAVECFRNIDTSHTDDVPTGIVMYFPPSAVVDPTLISDNMFQHMSVSSVMRGGANDEHFQARLESLQESVQQHPKDAYVDEVRHPSHNRDTRKWSSELGGVGSFVGAFYQLEEDHRTKTYYLAARGTVPHLVQNLKNSIGQSQPTYRDLVSGDEWQSKVHYARYAVHRNVQRNLAQAAEAFQVSIRRMDDTNAFVADPQHAPPERAVPQWQQDTFSIQSCIFKGQPAVALYNGVVPSQNCPERFFVVGNPYDGVHVVPITEPVHAALPADTGRNGVGSKFDETRLKGVIWESKRDNNHPDLHANAFNKLVPSTYKQSGWNPENHIGLMVPIAIKIFNNNI